MILFSFDEKPIQKMDAIKSGLKSRWVVFAQKWAIGICKQNKTNYSKWNLSDQRYVCSIKPFKFGRFHDFYNGDLLAIGWIHFEWKSFDCEKCFDGFIDRLKKRNKNHEL